MFDAILLLALVASVLFVVFANAVLDSKKSNARIIEEEKIKIQNQQNDYASFWFGVRPRI